MPYIAHYAGTTTVGSKTISTTFNVVSSNSLILVFVNAVRSIEALFTISSASIGGTEMIPRGHINNTANNRSMAEGVFSLKNVGAGSRTVTATISANSANLSIFIIEVAQADANPFAQIVKTAFPGSTHDLFVPVSTSRVDSLWLGTGQVQSGANDLSPVAGTTKLLEQASGSTAGSVVAGLFTRSGSGNYNFGGESSGGENGNLFIAVELIGVLPPAIAEGAIAADAEPNLGSLEVDASPAIAEGYAEAPEIFVGSVPATQVIWHGNAFLSTKAQVLSALLITTSGENWVLPSGGSVETFSVRITRRAAYLIPQ